MSNPGHGPPPPGPAQPLAPGNHDKAWNDPPLFSYSVSSGPQPGGASRLSTKRVGFPSSQPPPPGQDPTAPPTLHDAGAKPPSSYLPPPPSISGTLLPPPVCPSGDATANEATEISTISVEETINMFEVLTKSNLDTRKCEDINKRLAVMFMAWKEGKINPRIQSLVAEIGCKLSSKDVTGAEATFVVLSADYGGEIGAQWVLAVRHLLTAVKQNSGHSGAEEGVTKPL